MLFLKGKGKKRDYRQGRQQRGCGCLEFCGIRTQGGAIKKLQVSAHEPRETVGAPVRASESIDVSFLV